MSKQNVLGLGTLLVSKTVSGMTLLAGPMQLTDGRKAYLSAKGTPKKGYEVEVKAIAEEGQAWPCLATFKTKPFSVVPRQTVATDELGPLAVYCGTTRNGEPCIRVMQKGAVTL